MKFQLLLLCLCLFALSCRKDPQVKINYPEFQYKAVVKGERNCGGWYVEIEGDSTELPSYFYDDPNESFFLPNVYVHNLPDSLKVKDKEITMNFIDTTIMYFCNFPLQNFSFNNVWVTDAAPAN